jgi:hypothetical protein
MMRWLLAALLWIALVSATIAQQGTVLGFPPGVFSARNVPAPVTYTGPGDLVSGATVWYGLRGYNAAYATGSNNAVNVRRVSDNATQDIVILSSGALDIASANTFAELGASPILVYTVTLTSSFGNLAATGVAVAGSGTKVLTIVGTVAVVNTALGTLTDTDSVVGVHTIGITTTDANSQAATPQSIQVTVGANANTYILFPSLAAAQTRSQQMCASFGTAKCDGTNTIYWWNLVGPLTAGTAGATPVTAGSYAVEIQANGPFAANPVVGPCAVCGLTPGEKTSAVTAPQLAPLLPVVVTQ